MNPAHLHLALNHVPVLGALFALGLLAWGLLRRDDSVQRTALSAFVLVALAAIPVYLTGEPAEEVVERLAGVAEPAIEAHEDAALAALIGIELLGVVALAGLLARATRASRMIVRAVLVLALGAAGLMARTANLGGQIRHAEVRDGGVEQGEDDRHDRGRGR
jgi:uncharacterized membrane protein